MSKNPALRCPIQHQARVCPQELALVSRDECWTYEDLHHRISGTANRLQQAGLGDGTRVALHAPRSPDTLVLFWSLWRIGGVAVPLNLRWPSTTAIEAATRVGAEVCITNDDEVADTGRESLHVHRLREMVDRSAGVPSDDRRTASMPWEQPVTLVFTSGSTGTPKAALHTWGNHVASALGSNANIPVDPGDRWLLSLPLYHVGGLAILVRCALGGGTVVLPHTRASVAEQLAEGSITHASLVATQLRRLLQSEAAHPASMSALLVGGGAVPEALVEDAHRRGWPIHTTYGCTEMASQVTTTAPGASCDDLTTAGRVLPHRRLRIAEDGEILVAGAPLFLGYVDAEGLHDPRDDDGWFHTGDLGSLDAYGRLRVEGRKDRMFISGGENVQPEEVERALEALPAVERAIVVPVEDDEYGHRPVAFLQMDAAEIPSERLAAELASTLPAFMVPDAFLLLPSEADEGMKVDRAMLRRRAHEQIRG